MPGHEIFGEDERRAVNEVFDNGAVLFRHGFDEKRKGAFKVIEFEQAFASWIGSTHAQSVTSGSAAVKVALKGLGIGPGDEVITQCHTFVATVEAILECGATPVITEIDETLNMDPTDLARLVTDRTKAILPVHMLGVPARMEEILRLADEAGIPVVEDTAQALGGSYKGKPLGTLGKAGTFSFDFAKLMTTGEGGMVVTADKEVWRAMREYHDHGHQSNPALPRGRDTRVRGGFNYRMNELQGAIGLAQLLKVDGMLARHRENKAALRKAIADRVDLRFRTVPDEAGDTGDALVFLLGDPEAARRAAANLAKHNVATKNLPDAIDWHFAGTWEHMLAGLPQYAEKPIAAWWPRSDRILRSSIALPVRILMTQAEIEATAEAVAEAVRG